MDHGRDAAIIWHCPLLEFLRAQPNDPGVPQPEVANALGIRVPHNPQSVEQTQQLIRVEHDSPADRCRLRRVAMEPLHHDETAWPQRLVTALQRSALLNLAWDHISSGLDGRESAFELPASGGIPTWRTRLRRWFRDYNELANGVLKTLDLDMPMLDLNGLRQMFLTLRRPVSVPSQRNASASS
jgi:hypothetical protein